MQLKISDSSNLAFKAIYSKQQQEALMARAKDASNNSKCFKTKTGAIVVSEYGSIVGTGYNTPPKGLKNPCESLGKCIRQEYSIPSGKYHECTHLNVDAEANALLVAGNTKAKNGTLFLFGHYHLCDSCKLLAITAQIKDFYIQMTSDSPIKHYSLDDIIEQLKTSFDSNYKELIKNMGKKA